MECKHGSSTGDYSPPCFLCKVEELEGQLTIMTEARDKYALDIVRWNADLDDLRRQLATMTQERDKFERSAKVLMVEKGNACIAWEQERNKLAASQAYSQQLREALEKLARLGNEPLLGNSIGNRIAQEALALPQDDTALRQWGAKLLKEIERGADSAYKIMCRVSRKVDELEGKK